ncbi:MAG: DUF2341 domain-containing protein [Thermoplasmatales archaeon]|nr:MAG: DUF2341 domain-containing protein [Thermoplasmatales archaeon]
MKNNMLKKTMVFGIIILFVGASIVSNVSSEIKNVPKLTISDDWWDNEWHYRKKITIDHNYVDDNLNSFPVLVVHISSDLADNAQHDGDDFVFTTNDGIKLNHEIEKYVDSYGELVAWVNVPSLSSTVDTSLYMYYGNSNCANQQNSEMVWDSNYQCVYHMNEPSGHIYDSTVYENIGIKQGSLSYQAPGKVGYCVWFSGNGYFDYVLAKEDLDTNDACIEIWVNWDGSSPCDGYFGWDTTNDNRFYFSVNPSHWNVGWGNLYSQEIGTSDSNWHYMSFRATPGEVLDVYIDTIYQTTFDSIPFVGTSDIRIGTVELDSSYYWYGLIDEVRVSNSSRTQAWISTSFNNQNDPSSFMSFGPEEIASLAPSAPIINGPLSGTAGKNYSYTFVSIDPNDDDVFYEIDWGDGDIDPWDGPYESNELISKDHIWSEQGEFTIKARAKDVNDNIGEWGTLEVTMPKNKAFNFSFNLLSWLFERLARAFPILGHLSGL